ncbi:Eukaryotic translation initiation factor 4G [Acorus calamus]|uniref:Eukaryotic translation initiation factor 4G n=1 Tax=Acorus calamus TaxID=4465 RepID=A0AAV9DZF0_ACOCL|nr:Eukaryotic translation initiation factor 4G [Acorus calamus]
MSIRGHSLTPSIPLADTGESRRMDLGPNGHGSLSDWTPYGPKEELMPKSIPDRFSGTHDQLNPQDRNASFVNRDIRNSDRAFDRSTSTTPPGVRLQGSSLGARNVLPDTKILSEEFLREKSESAIKEFYRKDKERELLAKLLVTLCKSHDNLLKQVQLIQGFESVLSTMEDALNDAPKAAEFLGRIFAKMIIEDVVTLRDIGKIIHEGGEEPGRLLEIGVASEVLGSTLETIKVVKGDWLWRRSGRVRTCVWRIFGRRIQGNQGSWMHLFD